MAVASPDTRGFDAVMAPPDHPPPDEADSSDHAGDPEGSRGSPEGEDTAAPENTPGQLEDRAPDLVDKLQENSRSREGSSFWSCGGCVLLLAVLLAVAGFYLLPGITARFSYRQGPSDEIGGAARRMMSFELPGGLRGGSFLRAFVEVAAVENRRRSPAVRLILHRFPGGWPGWLRDGYLWLEDAYRRTFRGLSVSNPGTEHHSLCGEEVLVKSETGEGYLDGRDTAPAGLRRGCVSRGGDVLCATVVAVGEEPTSTTRRVFDSLSCP